MTTDSPPEQGPGHSEPTGAPAGDDLAEAVVAVDIDAEADAVWRALTTNDGFAGWIGEGSTIGSEPGESIDVNDVVTGERKVGVLDELTPNRRLGYTWWPETAPERATRVAIELEPCPTGTRVTVIEFRPTPVSRVSPVASTTLATSQDPHVSWAWRSASLVVGVGVRHLVGARVGC